MRTNNEKLRTNNMWINRLKRRIFKIHESKEVQQQELEKISRNLELTNARLAKLEEDLEKAVAVYRQTLINRNPDILPELIGGESIEALDCSLLAARELTDKVYQQLEKKAHAEHIPGGAPVRTPPDTENLTSHEKIVYGLEQK
jgi:hypothetical protein